MTDRGESDSGDEEARHNAPRPKEAVWRLPDGVHLSWKVFGDEIIVFNAFSGQTHLLDGLSAAVLEEIERAPVSLDALAARLAERFDPGDEAALVERLRAVLAEFDRQGLADPTVPAASVP